LTVDVEEALANKYDLAVLARALKLALKREACRQRCLPYVDLEFFERARLVQSLDGAGYIEVTVAPGFPALCSLPKDARTLRVACGYGRLVVRSETANVIGVSWEE
jgi:hypothetical protein